LHFLVYRDRHCAILPKVQWQSLMLTAMVYDMTVVILRLISVSIVMLIMIVVFSLLIMKAVVAVSADHGVAGSLYIPPGGER